MKKLTCTLLMAMFTMTSMLFAQVSGGPIIVVSDYITITNKTTKESKTILTGDFTSEGNNKYTYDVDFCLGVYNGDEIEITYKAKTAILDPNVAWSYSWNNGSSSSLGAALTANLLVNNVPFDKSVLTFTCNYLGNKQNPASRFYNIRIKNVHNVGRVKVTPNHTSKEFLLGYAYYDELLSCSKQGALASLYTYPYGDPVSSSYFTSIASAGRALLSTGNKSGTYIVTVTVNNTVIYSNTMSIGN